MSFWPVTFHVHTEKLLANPKISSNWNHFGPVWEELPTVTEWHSRMPSEALSHLPWVIVAIPQNRNYLGKFSSIGPNTLGKFSDAWWHETSPSQIHLTNCIHLGTGRLPLPGSRLHHGSIRILAEWREFRQIPFNQEVGAEVSVGTGDSHRLSVGVLSAGIHHEWVAQQLGTRRPGEVAVSPS